MNHQRTWPLTLTITLGLAILVALLLMAEATAQAPNSTSRYVATTGVDSGACTNPATPCHTVQYAVDAADDGDEVLVATGVYTGVQVRAGITQVVYISQTVAVRGGYRADFGAWDPEVYSTTLDAEGQGSVIHAVGPGITLTLESLHITGGQATTPDDKSGGGIDIFQATAFLRNNQVYSNTAYAYGGGIALSSATVSLEANTIQSNTTQAPLYYFGGGALYATNCELALTNNIMRNNTSGERGGGVYLGGGHALLVGNTFVGNQGIGREGGAVHLEAGTATLSENTFRDNSAHWGGGVYANQGTLTLTHNLFVSNTVVVYSGGAVSLQESVGTLSHNVIMSNTANNRGGGVHVYSQYIPSYVTLDANLILGNHAQNDGGGVFVMGNVVATLTNNVIADNRADGHGDGLSSWGATTHLLHNTLARNAHSGLRVEAGPVHLTNTLFFSQTVGIDNAGGTVTATTTLWDSVLTPTLGLVAESGSFAGSAALAADGYHLTAASDAVDAGEFAGVGSDLDGERRPMGGGPDLGADEVPSTLGAYLPLVLKLPPSGPGPTPPAR